MPLTTEIGSRFSAADNVLAMLCPCVVGRRRSNEVSMVCGD